MATANGTLEGGNERRRRASDDGINVAAPMAWITRNAIRMPADGASPQAIDATVNSVEPNRKARLWPSRSANLPAGTRSAANTIVYALSTHDSWAGVTESNVATMSGNATNSTVVSRKTASTASDAIARVRAWRGVSAGGAGVGAVVVIAVL